MKYNEMYKLLFSKLDLKDNVQVCPNRRHYELIQMPKNLKSSKRIVGIYICSETEGITKIIYQSTPMIRSKSLKRTVIRFNKNYTKLTEEDLETTAELLKTKYIKSMCR